MPLDPESFAEMVVQTVDTALGPVLERLAGLDARVSAIGDVRDRMVAIETKTAAPPVTIDLTPILERLAATEATIAVVRDLVRTPGPTEAADFAPEDVAASLDGLLRKAFADLETTTPAPTRKRIERDGNAFVVTELREAV